MKKIYTSLVALAIAAGASAQNAPVPSAKHRANDNGVALEEPTTTPSVAATGDTINGLYYDFSNAANWTFGNDGNPSADWEITTAGPTGDFSESYGPLESTTAANGWAMFDSDAVGNGSSVQNAWIQLANSVDLTGFNSVAVVWQQFYTRFNDNVYLEVSIDGGTSWTTYEVNGDIAGNSSSDNPDSRSVNISGVAGGQATVWIRFRFEGSWYYFWQVYDFAFVEGATNDIQLSKTYHGDIINAWEYQQIPLVQVQEVVLGAISYNGGGDTQTNVTYTYDISNGSGSVDSGTFPATNASLASTGTDTTWYATGFTPSAVDDYTVTISVTSDETDEVPGNNEIVSMFMVTESVYAHDDEDNIEFQFTGTDANGDVAGFKAGMYYDVFVDGTIYAVQVAFGG
jgi:hypothetical protein